MQQVCCCFDGAVDISDFDAPPDFDDSAGAVVVFAVDVAGGGGYGFHIGFLWVLCFDVVSIAKLNNKSIAKLNKLA